MAAKYAERTSVNSSDSRNEIERVLVRYHATAFQYGWDEIAATIGFRIRGRVIKFRLPLPDRKSRDITHTPERGFYRDQKQQDAAFEQAVRQRWRALLLIIKAKLEAVEAGIVSLESEFLAQTMLADGSTVSEWVGPQIEEVYRTGGMPSLLPGVAPKALPQPEIRDI
jgi:hypothetical protein